MKIKQSILLLVCKTIFKPLSYKTIKEEEKYLIESKDMSLIKNTTFNLYRLNISNQIYYFREIRKHSNFKSYLKELLNDYFYFCNPTSSLKSQQDKIYSKLCSKRVIKKIYNMGIVNDISSKIYIYLQNKDRNIFSLNDLKDVNDNDLKDLFQFLWGEIYSYRLNNGVKKNFYQTFNSSKILATKRLADLIGLNELIPDVKMVKLIIDNKIIKYGTMMNSAKGISPCCIDSIEVKNITPELQRQCISLHLLDCLSYEKDHRPGNYNVLIKNNKLTSINAFDNDAPLTFFISSNINMVSYLNSCPFVDNNNLINLEHIDYNLANRIIKIDKNEIYLCFENILSKIQIEFLIKRIYKMKKAIIYTVKEKKDFLLKKNEWTNCILEQEIKSGKNTYLKILINNSHDEHNYFE